MVELALSGRGQGLDPQSWPTSKLERAFQANSLLHSLVAKGPGVNPLAPKVLVITQMILRRLQVQRGLFLLLYHTERAG